MPDVEAVIRKAFGDLWADDHDGPPPVLEAGTVLLQTGLDSMAFAVLVTQLDDELGVDPFSMDENAVYPATFGEFVAFYRSHMADV